MEATCTVFLCLITWPCLEHCSSLGKSLVMAGVCHVLVSGSCAVLMGVQIPPQSVSDCQADSGVG